jgi:hypothetical protein
MRNLDLQDCSTQCNTFFRVLVDVTLKPALFNFKEGAEYVRKFLAEDNIRSWDKM